jgi:GAF domain-containing protein
LTLFDVASHICDHAHFTRAVVHSESRASDVRSCFAGQLAPASHLTLSMPPRTLASLAHALTVANDVQAALGALGEALVEIDRFAQLALVKYDHRRSMLRERLVPSEGGVEVTALETTIDHLPNRERVAVMAGGQFVEFGDSVDEFARLFGLRGFDEPGWLSARGIRFEGQLSAILVLYETKKIFGTRTSERFGPSAALFDLALVRFLEHDARAEAVETLEGVTQRVHDEYERRLAELQAGLAQAATDDRSATTERVVSLERELARSEESARQATRRAEAVEATVTSAVEQLEKAHIELARRNELLREKTRTLYLIDRVLSLDASTDDPRQLVEGLLSLVGDDMHAQRCSLMLRAREPGWLYLASARGIAPGVAEGARIRIGEGVSGRVAASREPLLVRDVSEAKQHPLLRDQYFTTGSFISFPLVYHDDLVGVVNLTNRAMYGVFGEEDIERVRLLGLVIALVASRARLPERLHEMLSVR